MLERSAQRPKRGIALFASLWLVASGLVMNRWPLAAAEAEAEAVEELEPSTLFDPSLGGKLHVTYRAAYLGKFFRYSGYRFNFAENAAAGTATELAARELEARHKNRSDDHDLDQFLTIRTKDLFLPLEEKTYLNHFDTELGLRWFNDLDGSPRGDEAQDGFDGLDGRDRLQVRTVNVRAETLGGHLEITGGRQYHEGAEWLLFDGVRARVRGIAMFERPLELYSFAGARVSFYRTLPQTTVWGGGLTYRPWESGRLDLETSYFIDNTLQATFDQELGEHLNALLVYRQIDEDPESVRLSVTSPWNDAGLTLWGEYLGKFGLRNKDFVFDYTARVDGGRRERSALRYFNLGDIDPFDEGRLEARYEPGRAGVGLLLGGAVHARREGDTDAFNHDWQEVWGGVDTAGLPWEGLTTRTVARYLHTDLPRRDTLNLDPFFSLVRDAAADGEPSFIGLETLLEQDIARRFLLGASLELRLYEYESRFAAVSDLLGFGATVYGRYRQNRFLSFGVSYLYDRDFRFVSPDLEDVHGVRADVLFSF